MLDADAVVAVVVVVSAAVVFICEPFVYTRT